ncbi:DNA polymerase III subunit alpha [Streptomyces sp. NPDC051684]|uniref:DNA polymerase III subunit alpha n=1 Tax=Streptomyces sp. NPDC051684 TaxID=3365670 RepID=UPI0037A82FA5
MRGFTHLHTASGFSLRYGASHPDALAERAAERGLDALALTDRDTLGGAVRFAKAASRAGIRPLFGVDLAVAAPAEAVERTERRRTPARGGAFVDESAQRVVFLARDGAAGWAELCRLVTAAHRDAGGDRRPLLPWDALGEGHDRGGHVFVLLGPESDVGRALAAGRPDRAARLLAPWRERYGSAALRIEVVSHGLSGTGSGSLRQAARALGFAADQGILPVLGNAVRYADSGQGPVADVLDSARRLVPIDPRGALDSGERWLKPAADMVRIAEQVSEAAGYGENTARRLLAVTEDTAAACRVDPEDDLGLGRVHFPEPGLVGAARRTPERVLRSRTAAAMLARRYDHKRRYWDRLEDELGLIERLGYASYFLTVAQVVEDTRDLGIRVAARGSGAGSLVNHLLGIATADPVEHGLLMERFLSEQRMELPDIDIDVESARRLEVYRSILDRFGPERVATVSMPETYRVRHAVRDVGLALGMEPAEVDRLAKSFPHIRARDARSALRELPELRGIDPEAHGGSRMWDLVEALDALPRGIAMHPCGVLLSDTSLLRRTPVVPTSTEGFPMSQFDKEDVEDLGLLKLDVLGVRMQSAMAHSVREIERVDGRSIDLDDPAQVPQDDPRTYRLIKSSQTLGCFQTESPGQRDLLARLLPETFHDLVVDISLFRPGPVAANMVDPFIKARHGKQAPAYPHPDLKGALEETCGVVVFHEQIIRILNVMTGCSLAFGDYTRRALSRPDQLGRVRAWFAQRARERGYEEEVVARTWEIVEAFGAYGFCKAHAVAFAVPSYQSAWLKTHHPAAFYAGLLTHDPGMYPKRLLLADARRWGVPVLPLDVNASDPAYQIELVSDGGDGFVHGVRLALDDVRGMSEAEAARIVAGRPYVSLQDFLSRARPSRPVAERLAQVGALDAFGRNRRDLMLHIAESQRGGRSGAQGQLALGETDAAPDTVAPAQLPDLDDAERLGAELGVLGMDTSRHLLGDHRELLDELGVASAHRLKDLPHGQVVLVAGAKGAVQTPPVRSGKRVIFTTLDDTSGLVDCAFFEDSHDASAHTVFHSWLLLVRGVVQRRGGGSGKALSVTGSAAWDLAELAELRRTGGLSAVTERLTEERPATVGAADGGRSIRLETGYDLHPWADLQPPGESVKQSRKLWHQSPGSAG